MRESELSETRHGAMGTKQAIRRASRAPRGVTRTGIIRHIDELGRIVIPIEIRKRFGLGEKDPLEISVKDETILLSKPKSACVFCGQNDSLAEFRGRCVCRSCIGELTAQA
jgi:AbrB family transcriptional regulator, transcriptional pleiotropic regulator of transition state genes